MFGNRRQPDWRKMTVCVCDGDGYSGDGMRPQPRKNAKCGAKKTNKNTNTACRSDIDSWAKNALVYRKDPTAWTPNFDLRLLNEPEYAWMKSGPFYQSFDLEEEEDEDRWFIGPAPAWPGNAPPTTDRELGLFVDSIQFWGVDVNHIPPAFFTPLFRGFAIYAFHDYEHPVGAFLFDVCDRKDDCADATKRATRQADRILRASAKHRLVAVLKAGLAEFYCSEERRREDPVRFAALAADRWGAELTYDADAFRLLSEFMREHQVAHPELSNRVYDKLVTRAVEHSSLELLRILLAHTDAPMRQRAIVKCMEIITATGKRPGLPPGTSMMPAILTTFRHSWEEFLSKLHDDCQRRPDHLSCPAYWYKFASLASCYYNR